MAYKQEQIIEALEYTGGMIYLAAERLQCAPNTIMRWAKRSPTVQAVIDKWRGKMIDVSERQLYSKVQAGDNWAIGFVLKNLGSKRGYIERQEIDHSGNVGTPTTFADWVKIETERAKKEPA